MGCGLAKALSSRAGAAAAGAGRVAGLGGVAGCLATDGVAADWPGPGRATGRAGCCDGASAGLAALVAADQSVIHAGGRAGPAAGLAGLAAGVDVRSAATGQLEQSGRAGAALSEQCAGGAGLAAVA